MIPSKDRLGLAIDTRQRKVVKTTLRISLPIMVTVYCLTQFVAAGNEQQHQFELPNETYISQAFDGASINPERVWIRGELRDQIESILGHPVGFIRTKYWAQGGKSVWILEEIGKDKLISVGHTIEHKEGRSQIADVKVLAYRESRGWEVKYPFFTNQFVGLGRKKNGRGLEGSIDGITGATLSVRALKKLAEVALLLDEHVRKTQATS